MYRGWLRDDGSQLFILNHLLLVKRGELVPIHLKLRRDAEYAD